MIYAITENIYIGNGLYSERHKTCLFMLTTTLYNGKNGSGAPYGNIYIYIYSRGNFIHIYVHYYLWITFIQRIPILMEYDSILCNSLGFRNRYPISANN